MKIKVFNHQTNAFQEKAIAPGINTINRWLIGRHHQCDLVLNSSEVSRIHALIDYHNNQYYFIDLNSTDGSRINNQEAQVNYSYLLQPDDIIRIGDFVLVLEDWELDSYPQLLTSSTIDLNRSADRQSEDLIPISSNQVTHQSPRQLLVATLNQNGITARCVQVIAETPDVKTFRLLAPQTKEFTYQPGQFITLDLEIDGKRVQRSYSLSSTPSRPHYLEITVKRVPSPIDAPDAPPGLVSNWLHDHVKVGSELKLRGAYGDFTCIDNLERKLLFISAGSGITPMMSMARWLYDTHADTDVVFIHSAKTAQDLIFRQELQLMASRYPRFQLAINLTRPQDNEPWFGYTGRLNAAMLAGMAPDFRERLVYVCGCDPFRASVKELLVSADFPGENYYEESFGVSQPKQVNLTPQLTKTQHAHNDINNTIVFTKSGQEVAYADEQTILEVAQDEGIDLPYGCGQGVCGQCKLRKLAGEVCYAQEPACEEGFILTCIAQPVGRVAIEA